ALWLPTKVVLDVFLKPGEILGQIATPFQVLTLISYQCYGLLALFVVNAVACWREHDLAHQKENLIEQVRKDFAPEKHITLPNPVSGSLVPVAALNGPEN